MNQSIKHDAPSDRTTAHNMRSSQLAVMPHYRIKPREVTKKHTAEEKTKTKRFYLFECHNTHQLSNTGDIGMTETQQREQSVGLSNEKEDMIQSVLNVLHCNHILLA